MFLRSMCLLLLALHGMVPATAQLYIPRNIQWAYEKGTRSLDGTPGKNYWQNTATYQLNIQFDPLSRYLAGTAHITYTNNSPDTLEQIWFKLYPNLYQRVRHR